MTNQSDKEIGKNKQTDKNNREQRKINRDQNKFDMLDEIPVDDLLDNDLNEIIVNEEKEDDLDEILAVFRGDSTRVDMPAREFTITQSLVKPMTKKDVEEVLTLRAELRLSVLKTFKDLKGEFSEDLKATRENLKAKLPEVLRARLPVVPEPTVPLATPIILTIADFLYKDGNYRAFEYDNGGWSDVPKKEKKTPEDETAKKSKDLFPPLKEKKPKEPAIQIPRKVVRAMLDHGDDMQRKRNPRFTLRTPLAKEVLLKLLDPTDQIKPDYSRVVANALTEDNELLVDEVGQEKAEEMVAEWILLEKRRRTQVYAALNHLISAVTYFDFFAKETFNIAKTGKLFAQIYTRKSYSTDVTSDLLLLAFFRCSPGTTKILQDSGITEDAVAKIVHNIHRPLKQTFLQKKLAPITFPIMQKARATWEDVKKFWIVEKLHFNRKTKFAFEVNLLFEKAADNARDRFKTPVISPEILFITMVEERQTKASKIVRKFVGEDLDWFVLRYKLIKRIHLQESTIRGEVPKGSRYFAYLLHTGLRESSFNKLIETDTLHIGVSYFRSKLITAILERDIFKIIKKDIRRSRKINKKERVYTTLPQYVRKRKSKKRRKGSFFK
jgi:hypothetical protein